MQNVKLFSNYFSFFLFFPNPHQSCQKGFLFTFMASETKLFFKKCTPALTTLQDTVFFPHFKAFFVTMCHVRYDLHFFQRKLSFVENFIIEFTFVSVCTFVKHDNLSLLYKGGMGKKIIWDDTHTRGPILIHYPNNTPYIQAYYFILQYYIFLIYEFVKEEYLPFTPCHRDFKSV